MDVTEAITDLNRSIPRRTIMRGTPILIAVLVLSLAPFVATAAKLPACGTLPSYVRDAERTLAYCITTENPITACGATDVDAQVFGNNEGRLPGAGRGQLYYEGKARQQAGGPAGTYRLVYLVTEGKKKQVVEQRYYSADHYQSFCAI
jgi:guanyl-specific ribonuclease Sa